MWMLVLKLLNNVAVYGASAVTVCIVTGLDCNGITVIFFKKKGSTITTVIFKLPVVNTFNNGYIEITRCYYYQQRL